MLEMEGTQHASIRRGVAEQIANNIFRKYKQGSAFRVSGVFQLAKTGCPIPKNIPLPRMFLSDAMMLESFTHFMTPVPICIF